MVSHRISGGGIPANLYRAGKGAGFRLPFITRHDLFSSRSTLWAWQDLAHTRAYYSAAAAPKQEVASFTETDKQKKT